MAELTPADRIQPCLLDRLTDDQPQQATEAPAHRVISARRYREGVLRDMEWLLNAAYFGQQDLLDRYPHVRRSVLNFGIPDLCGFTMSAASASALEQAVAQAIRAFEPRINPQTLSVRMWTDPHEAGRRNVGFRITGDLWAKPAPEALAIQSEIDAETGRCDLNSGPRAAPAAGEPPHG